MNSFLSLVARTLARATGIVRHRGIGRLFKPLSKIGFFRSVEGTAQLGSRKIVFPAFDYYWASFLWPGRTYEPDVEAIFKWLSPIKDKIFVDCGANIGYWTVKLSEPEFGYRRFIAVEANAAVFRYLQKNFAINSIEGSAHLAAIAEESGQTVYLDAADGHAVGTVGRTSGSAVSTVSVSHLIGALDLSSYGGRPLAVVKLDVEGSEIAGIRGALGVEAVDLLFVYEDWPRSGMTVSKYLLDEGFPIIGVEPGGETRRLQSLEEVLDFNRRTSSGYGPSNLVATRHPERFVLD